MTQHDDAAAVALRDGSESDAVDVSSRADRPTLTGLAPVENEAETGDAAASEPVRSPTETSTVRPVQELVSHEEAPAATEDDPEWLDLSTRWMIPPVQPLVDEDEVTEHAQWADRLAVHGFARGEPLSAAAPPPPQPLPAAPPGLRVTMPFGRSSELPPAPRPAHTGPSAAQWAPRTGRHATLAGASARAEEHWRSVRDSYEPPPMAAPVQPAAAPWSGSAPPWEGYPAHYPASSRYAYEERHSRTPTGYTPFHIAKRRDVSARRPRASQHKASELSVELWNSISDTWLATLIKCALALVLLHYSGFAVPLLAFFGYAPTQTAAVTRTDAALQPAVPVAAALAAPSVTPERALPASDDRSTPQREVSATTEIITRPYRAKPAHKPKSAASTPHKDVPVAAASTPRVPPTPQALPQPLVAAAPPLDDAEGEAFLRINSRPWSQVFVDGTDVGHTPKLDLRVRAGVHRIRFVNSELGVSRTIQLHAATGATVSHVEFLEE